MSRAIPRIMSKAATPRNSIYLQSGWDLRNDVTFDVMFRYIDSWPVGVQNYLSLLTSGLLGGQPETWKWQVVGQDLFGGRHDEFVKDWSANPTQVEPGVYGMVTWRY